jgi:hypothetical protein
MEVSTHMKKIIIVVAAILIASSMAMASDTRVASIGQATTFLTDYTDIYLLPSTLVGYPRVISAELGTFPAAYPTNGSASIVFTNNQEQTWGVIGLDINHAIYGEQTFTADMGLINPMLPATMSIPLPDNKFHLFYARKVGTMTAGLHLARAAGAHTGEFSDSTHSWKEDNHSGIWDINAGVSMSPTDKINLDAAVAIQMLSFQGDYSHTTSLPAPATSGDSKIKNDGGSNIMLGARAFYVMSDELKIVPAIGVNMYSLGYKTSFSGIDTTGNAAAGGKKSMSNITGAFGLNYQPVENVTLVGGLHLGYSKTTVEDTMNVFYTPTVAGGQYKKVTITDMVLPGFSAGVEAKLLKWMNLRFGASKMLTSKKTELQGHNIIGGTGNVTRKSESSSAPYTFNFGLGLTFGKLAIDAKINDDQPFSLGYLMSGNTAERAPFTQISATYSF